MTDQDWILEYRRRLEEKAVTCSAPDPDTLAPVVRLSLSAQDWGTAAAMAAALGWRWAGVWGDPGSQHCLVYACLVHEEARVLLETRVPWSEPVLDSHTRHYPAADRMERHAQDLLGITFRDHPTGHRWTRHQTWREQDHPLSPEFPVRGYGPKRIKADTDYPFVQAQGRGVYEIPVGPVHAGIIEPGHFRFQAVGEEVLRLEMRLGYVHKGIEKIAVGGDPADLARLAGRISGDTTVAHAWAACQAMERAAGGDVPTRALHLRALVAERERIANHLGDIGAICNDVGFAFVHMQCARLREQWQRRNHELFGHRLLMDVVAVGGLACDLAADGTDTLRADHQALRQDVEPIFAIVDDHPSLDDRLLGTGRLSREDAQMLGCTGYVAKASGLSFDLRRDQPYPPYDHLRVTVPDFQEGDVASRVRVRMEEIHASLDLMDQLLDTLPPGEIASDLPRPAADAQGIGLIEGWRGEIMTYVRFDQNGRIARFFPRDPSWFLWPALERLIHGNIVPDFPVCNKSVNGSYSGHDL